MGGTVVCWGSFRGGGQYRSALTCVASTPRVSRSVTAAEMKGESAEAAAELLARGDGERAPQGDEEALEGGGGVRGG